MKSLKNNLKWIYFIARRFSLVDAKTSSAFTSRLSALGICFGVMTLIIVISVMNGFQSEFIDAIMEVSSYHIRAQCSDESEKKSFKEFLSANSSVLCADDFIESESLATTNSGKETALLARGVDPFIMSYDKGFERELRIVRGEFDLESRLSLPDGVVLEPIVIGTSLAHELGVRVGSEISMYSITSDKSLLETFSAPKKFIVNGIFFTGYSDINSTYAFMNIDTARKFFSGAQSVVGIKLRNSSQDTAFVKFLQKAFPGVEARTWREYNRSFFGVLRIEKNMLFFLVVLIFLVVAINIFNSMRRIVFERRFEISTLSALGGNISSIKNIFIMRGFLTGISGALPGMILGMFLCINIRQVFAFLSAAVFYVQYFVLLLFNPDYAALVSENPMFAVYGNIPARMYMHEIIFITLFGILSAVISSWLASREVLNTPISEVLHDE